MFQIAVCDDDKILCAELENILLEMEPCFQEKTEVEVFYNGRDLWNTLQQGGYEIDLLFLDIRMQYLDGIELGRRIREVLGDECMQIVYISNYDSYALELFEVRPLHFLKKPLTKNMVENVVQKAWNLAKNQKQWYCYLSGKALHKVSLTEVLYFSSQSKKVTIHTTTGNKEFYGKLSEVEKCLTGYNFISIHKSYLVNFVYIDTIRHSEVVLTNGETLPISNSHKEAVQKFVISTLQGKKVAQ